MYEYFFKNTLYPAYESLLMRRNTFHYHEEYLGNQYLSLDEIQNIQWKKTLRLLVFCEKHVPYYKRLWHAKGISSNDIKSIEDFENLPILTKDDIKANYEDLIAEPYIGKTLSKKTGGSTGVPLKLEFTRESDQRRTAVMWRGYSWGGGDIGKKTAYVWGGHVGEIGAFKLLKEQLYNRLFRRYFLNSFDLTVDNVGEYIEALNHFKPKVIVGYVNPMYMLAQYINERQPNVFSPTTILTGAESLLPFQRKAIQTAFGCPVFNTYGCREFMLIASECEIHNGLHINSDHLVVETLEKGSSVSGQLGELAITDLHNYGMPFIRYMNGDMGIISEDKCACGRGLPLLSSIEGRKLDVILTEDGKTLPGEFFPHLMKDVDGVKKFQVIQSSLSSLEIKIVSDSSFTHKSKSYIDREIAKVLGDSLRVEYNFVNDIALTKTGKYRVTISNINKTIKNTSC